MTHDKIACRDLELQDLGQVAEVHLVAFPTSALTKLGREAVRRYYKWQMIGPHNAVNVGAFAEDKLLGFCFGGVFQGALGGYLNENRFFLVRQVTMRPWLLFNPLFRERLAFAVRSLYRRTFCSAKPSEIRSDAVKKGQARASFGILSIAVAPQHQGSGAARLLMDLSERAAVERGFDRMGLTVHPTNERAVRFYEKMGWKKDEVDGAWKGHMSKNIFPQ